MQHANNTRAVQMGTKLLGNYCECTACMDGSAARGAGTRTLGCTLDEGWTSLLRVCVRRQP